MNNKRLISMTICWILVIVLRLPVLSFAGNESETTAKAEQYYEKANELRKIADYDAAITEYEKVISLSPEREIAQNAQYWIGQSYFKAGQFDDALSAFQQLLDEYPASTIIPSTKLMMERVRQAKKTESLFEAVTKGDTERAKVLIAAGADVNAKDEKGSTPLHRAVQFGHTAAVELLIAEGANIEARNRYGDTPLCQAAEADRQEVVKLLLKRGAYIDGRDHKDYTPLHHAIRTRHQDMVELLLANGAYIDGRDYMDYTPLHSAIRKGNQDMVELFLAKGAAPWRRRVGLGIVGIAMKANQKEMVRFLIDKGIEHSAVHVAAFFGDLDEVKSYLAKGCDINAQDSSRLTLLACAIFGGQAAEAEFLISKGADINLKGAVGRPALHWAIRTRRSEITIMLLDKGADITIRDYFGCTALFWAAQAGYKDIVKTMLAKGADINARSGVIIVWGVSNEGWMPLHVACSRGHKAVVELLIANGADINAKTKNGRTPMSLAKWGGREQVVELLRKHGADDPQRPFGLAVALTSPASDNYVAVGEPVLLKADVAITKDATVRRVEFLINGSPVGDDTDPPYQFNWEGAKQGSYSTAAKIYDSEGRTKQSLPVMGFVGIRGLRRFVARSADDAEEFQKDGLMLLDAICLDLAHVDNPHLGHVDDLVTGLRFTDIRVPRGARVKQAYVQFTVVPWRTDSKKTDLVLHAELAANAEPFIEVKRNITSRPATAASVKWSPEPWTVRSERSNKQRTPDLACLVQEVIDQPDWQEAGALVLIISGSGRRIVESWDAGWSGAPMLYVDY